jgi:hypothetical protein
MSIIETVLVLVKEYDLMVVMPLMIMVFFYFRWDKLVSNMRIEMRGGFNRINELLEEQDERLDDHETRIRQTERDLILFGRTSEAIEKK